MRYGVAEPRSDEDLLASHAAGSTGALDELIRRYSGELFGFLCRFVGSGAAADDLVQETFLQVHVSAATFDRERSFKPWLYTIAANKARDWLRGRARRSEQSLESGRQGEEEGSQAQIAAAAPPLDEALARDERRRAVRDVLDEMPEHLRMILVLGYFQHLPYADIADVLDVPVGTVKSRLHAAVNQFAKRWHARERTRAAAPPRAGRT